MIESPHSSPAPPVSVVIPTCNRRAVIEKCLTHLASQDHPNFEVIVVDDGSMDDTPACLASIADLHPALNFRWFRNDPQAGANAARNRGVHESQGTIIAFLDDDCLPEPNWLTQLTAGFVSDQIGALAGSVIDAPPKNLADLFFTGSFHVHSPDGVSATRLVGCNMAVRKDLLLRFGFDEDRATVSADVSVSGRGDESGLFHLIKAAGYEQRVAPAAVVLHDHPHTTRTFLRQAYRSGGALCRLVYKYRLRPPLELLTLAAAYVLMPGIWVGDFGWLAPATFAVVFLGGIFHSERSRKCKTVSKAFLVLPVAVVYYNLRLLGYVVQRFRLQLGLDIIKRSSVTGAP